MTSKNRSVPGESREHALARLTGQGMTVKNAAGSVGVTERHAYRLLKKFGDKPLTLERWSPATATREDPPEKIAWLFETYMDGGWSVEDAEVAWSIHCADETLEPWVVKAFCRLYVAAGHHGDGQGSRNRMIIDWALWYRTWDSPSNLWDYVQSLPVTEVSELDFAAEIAFYLNRYGTLEMDIDSIDPKDETVPNLQTVIEGVEDRWQHLTGTIDRLRREEEVAKREQAVGELRVVETPGDAAGRRKGRIRRATRTTKKATDSGEER